MRFVSMNHASAGRCEIVAGDLLVHQGDVWRHLIAWRPSPTSVDSTCCRASSSSSRGRNARRPPNPASTQVWCSPIPDEAAEIDRILEERIGSLDDADLDALGIENLRAQMMAGFAPHHAGMVPPFKEAVEVCFTRGLIRAVFATETLAVGVNMPARTVVIEKTTKYNGDHHVSLSPAEFTQLTGRAGRRGIDTIGYAVVLWSPWVRYQQVADLASSRTFGLRSVFRPTYNMTANLVRRTFAENARGSSL